MVMPYHKLLTNLLMLLQNYVEMINYKVFHQTLHLIYHLRNITELNHYKDMKLF